MQHLEPRTAAVAEDVGAAIERIPAQRRTHVHQQPIHPAAQIHRGCHQPPLHRPQHPRPRSRSTSHPAPSPSATAAATRLATSVPSPAVRLAHHDPLPPSSPGSGSGSRLQPRTGHARRTASLPLPPQPPLPALQRRVKPIPRAAQYAACVIPLASRSVNRYCHSTRFYARLVITTPASENQARACNWQTVKQQVRRADTYPPSVGLHCQQQHFFQHHVIQLTAVALHRQNLYSLTDE